VLIVLTAFASGASAMWFWGNGDNGLAAIAAAVGLALSALLSVR
jgi:hypothetical protein